ncbi:MAG: YihY/virulence factor BrkB family protein [Ignavibacteriales bacterium]
MPLLLAVALFMARVSSHRRERDRPPPPPPEKSRAAPREARAFAPGAEGKATPEEPASTAAAEAERGRHAETPAEIPPKGWKDVLWRTFQGYRNDNIGSVAGTIAFSGITALFPALAAFVSIYGMFADVQTARQQLAALAGVIPADAATLIGQQMVRIAAQKQATLSVTFLLSLLLSIWSANAGMKALFGGLNVAYGEKEKRNWFRLNVVTLAFTFGAVVFFALAMGAVVAVPVILHFLHLDALETVLRILRWPLLLLITMVGLAFIYRYGPSRERPKWRWVSHGSIIASLLWLLGSFLFSWYLANFAHYNATYGSLGAVFGFMMWLWLSSVIVLVGAEINAEGERQTLKDSTTGAPEPLGKRGAEAADTIGEAKTDSILPAFISKHLHQKALPPRGGRVGLGV